MIKFVANFGVRSLGSILFQDFFIGCKLFACMYHVCNPASRPHKDTPHIGGHRKSSLGLVNLPCTHI